MTAIEKIKTICPQWDTAYIMQLCEEMGVNPDGLLYQMDCQEENHDSSHEEIYQTIADV